MYEVDYYKDIELHIKLQPIDICRELPFSLGCAVKYILRAGHKTGKRDADLLKAVDYLKDYKKSMEEQDDARSGALHSSYMMSPRARLAIVEYSKRQPYIAMLLDPDWTSEAFTEDIDRVIEAILKEINEQK